MDRRNEVYQRALAQQALREEQRQQVIEEEGEHGDEYELEAGYVALLEKTVNSCL